MANFELTACRDRNAFGAAVPLAQLAAGARLGTVRYSQKGTDTQLEVYCGEEIKSPETLRKVGGQLANYLIEQKMFKLVLQLDSLGDKNTPEMRAGLFEGLLLGAFRFEPYKSKKGPEEVFQIGVFSSKAKTSLEKEVKHARAVSAAQNLAREWAHEPPNVLNPITLAERARSFGKQWGLDVSILDDQQLEALGAEALVSVGKGSATPSRMIILAYPGSGKGAGTRPIVFVGKAITFDTGGYSIKTTDGMTTMKYDKSGAMAVFGLMQAVASLEIETPVIGVIAAAENMIAGNAYRPQDILKTLAGITVEIISTDAEGRLVLADALTYASRHFKPRAMVDLATLTGGVGVALGSVRAGLMANNQALAAAIFESGERTGERVWQLPLDDEYLELIAGDDSDLKNSAGKPKASAIVGGIFLKQFVEGEVPWAHLDIASTGISDTALPYSPKGATGYGVRLLVDYLENLK